MAQIDARDSTIAFTMVDNFQVAYDSTDLAQSNVFRWLTATPFAIAALSFDDNLVYSGNTPSGGVVDALSVTYNTSNVYSVTDLRVAATSLFNAGSTFLSATAYWNTILAGDTRIYAPVAVPTNGPMLAIFFGDTQSFETGTGAGGNDLFVGTTLGFIGVNNRQTFIGDAQQVVAGAIYTGGNDTITGTAAGDAIGDVSYNEGVVTGGSDSITMTAGVSGGFTGQVVGDVRQSFGTVIGGNDTLSMTDTGSLTVVAGDVVSNDAATTGGNDTITVRRVSAAFDITTGSIVGDVRDGFLQTTGGNDTITITGAGGFVAGEGTNVVSGDVRTHGGAGINVFNGGGDTLTLTNVSYAAMVGDAYTVTGGTITGGIDTMTLTNAVGLVSGDLIDILGVATSFLGRGDTIAVTQTARSSAQTVYGDFRDSPSSIDIVITGGNDTIVYNDPGSTLAGVVLIGDGGSTTDAALVIGGNDTITYNGGAAVKVIGDVSGLDTFNFTAGNDTIVTGSGNDTIYGDFEFGGFAVGGTGGNDIIVAGSGDDTIFGGIGNDNIYGGLGSDTIEGGLGDRDVARYDNVAQSVYVDLLGISGSLGKEAMGQGFDDLIGIEDVVGSNLNDDLRGDANVNYLYGAGGADRLDGRGGNDLYIGGDGNDVFVIADAGDAISETNANTATGGFDTMWAYVSVTAATNVEAVQLQGGSNPINATGNALSNYLVGNSGVNVLAGVTGIDLLEGRGGNDFFYFGALNHSGTGLANADQILDFATGDKIHVAAIDANAGLANDQAFVRDLGGSFDAGEYRTVTSGADLLVEFNVDGGAADMVILVKNRASLADSDFLL